MYIPIASMAQRQDGMIPMRTTRIGDFIFICGHNRKWADLLHLGMEVEMLERKEEESGRKNM